MPKAGVNGKERLLRRLVGEVFLIEPPLVRPLHSAVDNKSRVLIQTMKVPDDLGIVSWVERHGHHLGALLVIAPRHRAKRANDTITTTILIAMGQEVPTPSNLDIETSHRGAVDCDVLQTLAVVPNENIREPVQVGLRLPLGPRPLCSAAVITGDTVDINLWKLFRQERKPVRYQPGDLDHLDERWASRGRH